MKTRRRKSVCNWLVVLTFLVAPVVRARVPVSESPSPAPPSSEARPAPHVVFVIGEREYFTHETLPAFFAAELEGRGVRATWVLANPDDPHDFPGLEALESADLLVLSVRRRGLPPEQLGHIRSFLERGGALVAIRTSSHAFAPRPPVEGSARWDDFDTAVLGHKYLGHHNNKPPEGPPSFVRVDDRAKGHPILEGVEARNLRVWSHLYKVRSLPEEATPLMVGTLGGQPDLVEPVALTHSFHGGRVFYTSLGSPLDFDFAFFRRLLLNAVFWALERPVPGKVTGSR